MPESSKQTVGSSQEDSPFVLDPGLQVYRLGKQIEHSLMINNKENNSWVFIEFYD